MTSLDIEARARIMSTKIQPRESRKLNSREKSLMQITVKASRRIIAKKKEAGESHSRVEPILAGSNRDHRAQA
jgi:hypothetical protein